MCEIQIQCPCSQAHMVFILYYIFIYIIVTLSANDLSCITYFPPGICNKSASHVLDRPHHVEPSELKVNSKPVSEFYFESSVLSSFL